jgi:hypothetical protein
MVIGETIGRGGRIWSGGGIAGKGENMVNWDYRVRGIRLEVEP